MENNYSGSKNRECFSTWSPLLPMLYIVWYRLAGNLLVAQIFKKSHFYYSTWIFEFILHDNWNPYQYTHVNTHCRSRCQRCQGSDGIEFHRVAAQITNPQQEESNHPITNILIIFISEMHTILTLQRILLELLHNIIRIIN